MGNFRAVLFVSAVSFVAACGDDGGKATPDAPVVIHVDAAIDSPPDSPPPPDAPNYDFSCMANPAPTTAMATLSVSGTTQGLNGMSQTPLNNVTLEARKISDDTVIDTDGPTGAQGTYTLGPIDTNNTPVDAYVRATRSGNGGERTTLVYPPQALVASQTDIPVLMVSDAQLNGLLGGVLTQDADKGFIGVAIVDCAGMPVAGADVVAKQGTAPAGTAFDLGSFAPQLAGTWFVFNVPPGDTTITATANGHTFRAHVVKSAAQTATTTVIRPGF